MKNHQNLREKVFPFELEVGNYVSFPNHTHCSEKPIAEAPLRPPARPAPIVPTSAGLSLVLAASLPTSSTPSRFLNPFPAPLPAEVSNSPPTFLPTDIVI